MCGHLSWQPYLIANLRLNGFDVLQEQIDELIRIDSFCHPVLYFCQNGLPQLLKFLPKLYTHYIMWCNHLLTLCMLVDSFTNASSIIFNTLFCSRNSFSTNGRSHGNSVTRGNSRWCNQWAHCLLMLCVCEQHVCVDHVSLLCNVTMVPVDLRKARNSSIFEKTFCISTSSCVVIKDLVKLFSTVGRWTLVVTNPLLLILSIHDC